MKPEEVIVVVIACARKVHAELGPGLLDSAYRNCLAYELKKAGLVIRSEVPVPIVYQTVHLHCGYRADLLVNDSVMVEVKSETGIGGLHLFQAQTHMRMAGIRFGLILNFNVEEMEDGIRKVTRDPQKEALS